MAKGIALALLVLLAAAGLFLRRDYALPFLYGTWLASAVEHTLGKDMTDYLGVPYIGVWSFLTFSGFAAALIALTLPDGDHPSLIKFTRRNAYVHIMLTVFTGLPWFAFPLVLAMPLIVLTSAATGATMMVILVFCLAKGSRPVRFRLAQPVTAVAGAFIMVALFDWLNLLLIGGS
jgi:hypothetical protein